MTVVAAAYAFLALGFCLGFVTCALLVGRAPRAPEALTREQEANEANTRG